MPVDFDIDVSDAAVMKIVYQFNNYADGTGNWSSSGSNSYHCPIGNAGLYK